MRFYRAPPPDGEKKVQMSNSECEMRNTPDRESGG
jgi:hypothetical protein